MRSVVLSSWSVVHLSFPVLSRRCRVVSQGQFCRSEAEGHNALNRSVDSILSYHHAKYVESIIAPGHTDCCSIVLQNKLQDSPKRKESNVGRSIFLSRLLPWSIFLFFSLDWITSIVISSFIKFLSSPFIARHEKSLAAWCLTPARSASSMSYWINRRWQRFGLPVASARFDIQYNLWWPVLIVNFSPSKYVWP